MSTATRRTSNSERSFFNNKRFIDDEMPRRKYYDAL